VRAASSVTLGRGFEARLWLDYARWFYDMNPEPGDAYVAGGALDEMLTVLVGVAYAR
jgi:hypothetical protein